MLASNQPAVPRSMFQVSSYLPVGLSFLKEQQTLCLFLSSLKFPDPRVLLVMLVFRGEVAFEGRSV